MKDATVVYIMLQHLLWYVVPVGHYRSHLCHFSGDYPSVHLISCGLQLGNVGEVDHLHRDAIDLVVHLLIKLVSRDLMVTFPVMKHDVIWLKV
jgi:hypothetical protein